MLLNQHNKYNFKDQLKLLLKIAVFTILIMVILGFLFRNYFIEQSEITNVTNVIVENKAKKILEDIYNVPIILNVAKKDRETVLFSRPKRVFGNSIYIIDFISSQDTFSIHWEMIGDSLEIKKIENYRTKEIIFKYLPEVSTN